MAPARIVQKFQQIVDTLKRTVEASSGLAERVEVPDEILEVHGLFQFSKLKRRLIMAGKKTAVFGIYHNANQAERVGDRLREGGVSNDDNSVLLQENQG